MPRPLSQTVAEPSGLRVTRDLVGVAGKRLVDGVVDDLVDHVMEARAVVGVADIHARALAHGVEALEDLDRFGAIVAAFGDGLDFVHVFLFARLVCERSPPPPVSCRSQPVRTCRRGHTESCSQYSMWTGKFRPADKNLGHFCALRSEPVRTRHDGRKATSSAAASGPPFAGRRDLGPGGCGVLDVRSARGSARR